MIRIYHVLSDRLFREDKLILGEENVNVIKGL